MAEWPPSSTAGVASFLKCILNRSVFKALLAMDYSVVWFKRDLRVQDHAALHHACQQGPVLCLYVIEPSLWMQRDAATQHYAFIVESLQELSLQLQHMGGQLHVVVGEVIDVLTQLHAKAPFMALYAHEETGNGQTYIRDVAVGRWCRSAHVAWHEYPQFGVVRRLLNRDHWRAAWEAHMAQPQWPVPQSIHFADHPNVAKALHPFAVKQTDLSSLWMFPAPLDLGLEQPDPPDRQRGGRERGWQVLQDFLHVRSGLYRGGISSPLSAPTACSRLSPYLSAGCVSMREVVQTTRHHLAFIDQGELQGGDARASSAWHKKGLNAFMSRLYWHCHFIQKLESEPALEYANLHRGYNGLREADWNPAHFDALVAGRTGWPMVDACVAMLRQTGWLNFRMRAMLVSVAAYPLWLHWQPVGWWLAQQFLDYEPGIHWSQMQMQSGTTGMNTTRVYNPIKQAQDHDPQGYFVRQWLPAMRRVPDAWLLEPWRMPANVQKSCGVVVGQDIAMPLVELEAATRIAKQKLHARRAQPAVRAGVRAIVLQHGSRSRLADTKAAGRAITKKVQRSQAAQGRTSQVNPAASVNKKIKAQTSSKRAEQQLGFDF